MLAALALLSQTTAYQDITADLGLSLANAHACWVDLDRDGWTDLVAGGVVWRNEKGTRFTKSAEGFGNVVAADFDNDGYPDLFSWSDIKLFRNEAGKSFVPVDLPKLPATVSRSAVWGDFDGDAFVDLFIGGYEDWDKGITYPSMILTNQKGRGFELTWQDSRNRARGVTACDYDENGRLDIYVSNYRLQPNRLWRNDALGRFTDVARSSNTIATTAPFGGGHSIGAAWGDFDQDGHFDLFAGNFAHVDSRGDQPKSRFLRNLGPESEWKFDDLGPCGVQYQESYASPAAGDFDNDGRLDLYFTTVYGTASFGVKNFPVLFRNEGSFKFTDVTGKQGLAEIAPTYQAAFADFKNNGTLSLATGGKVFTRANEGNWLTIALEGDGKRVNRSAIGAQVRIRLGTQTLTRQVEAGTGEGNQNDLKLHFGLGDWTRPFDIEVRWPDKKRVWIRDAKPNSQIRLTYG